MQDDYEQLRGQPLLTESDNGFAVIIYQQGLFSWVERYCREAAVGAFAQSTSAPAPMHLQSAHFTAASRPFDGALLDEIFSVWTDMAGAHLPPEL